MMLAGKNNPGTEIYNRLWGFCGKFQEQVGEKIRRGNDSI
jgi:hypothetical protein